MKFSIKPVALAVTMALGASLGVTAARAAITPLPSYQPTVPGLGGLYLAVWNDSNTTTELVNLGMNYAGTTFSSVSGTSISGTNALTSAANAATFTATTVDGYSVLQDDVGQVANFASLFGSASGTTNYVILDNSSNAFSAMTSTPLATASTFSVTQGAITKMQASISQEVGAWEEASSTGGSIADTTGTTAYTMTGTTGPMYQGNDGVVGLSFGTAVGSAAAFFQGAWDNNSASDVAQAQYEYNGNAGFWFLSSTGDLSWNLITSASTVPLPPAVWLFASGLIGLALIGRRRRSGIGAAV